jgi:hypothetical protein
MFLRAEYGHFYKWLTSIGLALIAAAAALPWFVHQAADALTIPSAELETYTETARRVLESRQEELELTQLLLPWMVVLLVTLGVAASYFGLLGWKARQDKVDQSEDIDLAKKLLEIEQVPDSESEAMLKSEVLEDEAASVGSANEQPGAAVEPNRVAERMADLKRLEERASVLLAESFDTTHDVVSRVRVTTSVGVRIQVDAVAQDSSGVWGAIIQDTIRISNATLARSRVRDALQRLAYASHDISPSLLPTGDSPVEVRATGLLLVVLDGETADSVRRAVEEELAQINLVLKRSVALAVIERGRLESLTTESFKTLVLTALRNPVVPEFS